MRRIFMTAVASALLALALPAAASADHSARNEAVHHHRRHHHRHAHTVVFAAGSVRTMPGTTAPSTPSTPSSEPAATIVSFENGVLKLMLADHSTVSGKVTERTEIECRANREDNDANDDQGEGQGNGSQGGPGPSFSHDHGDDEHGGEQQQEGTCGVSSLQPGTSVDEADLAVTGAGSFWEKIELA